MTAENWATLITSVVVPLVLRILVHYWPWLADGPAEVNVARRRATPAPETAPPPEGVDGA